MARERGFQRHNIDAARELRKRQTPAEQRAWLLLKDRRLTGLKFRRQHPVGPYVLDFCCASKRLVVELDGEIHINQISEDMERQRELESRGYRFLRFTNDTVFEKPDKFIDAILSAAFGPSPTAVGEGLG